jgi:hypothetical protein
MESSVDWMCTSKFQNIFPRSKKIYFS